MVKTPSQTLEKFIVRLPAGMRDAIAASARTYGRSMNAEVVARLADSLQLQPPPAETGEIPTSRTAREAFALANENARKIDNIEVALMAICDGREFLQSLSEEARAGFVTALKIIGRT